MGSYPMDLNELDGHVTGADSDTVWRARRRNHLSFFASFPQTDLSSFLPSPAFDEDTKSTVKSALRATR